MDYSLYVVVLAVFEDDEAGAEAYQDLHRAEKNKQIELENTVLVSKDDEGKIHFKEDAEKMATEVGLGALVGGALGILAGPPGVIALGAIGAALGGLSARLDDVGFDDTRIKRLGESLEPGKSAIVAVLEGKYSKQLVEQFEKRGARVAVEDLPRNFKQILEEGGRFIYRMAEDDARDAAIELGLIKPEYEDYTGEGENPESDQSEE